MSKIKRDFNNKVIEIFNLLSIEGNYRIIGSASLRKIKYASDYDLETIFNTKEDYINQLVKYFKNKFITAKKDKNIFIIDFKAGEIDGEPIRWSYNDIMKGEKDGVKFKDIFYQKSTIKLDMICLINGLSLEFSDNYYIKVGKYNNDNTDSDIIKSLNKSAKEELKDKNYYKYLKRLYSILELEKKDNQQFTNYFNSDIGILNRARAELDILLLLLEQTFRKPDKDTILNNIQIIKSNLSVVSTFNLDNISKKLDMITKSNMKSAIKKIRDYLFKVINNDALLFIKKYNI